MTALFDRLAALDPLVQAGLAVAAGLALLLLVLVALALAGARRTARAIAPLADGLARLGEAATRLDHGQHRLAGGLSLVGEAQGAAQLRLAETLERRLEEVSRGMADSLHGTATRTARALGELQERLAAIDKAQANIEKLSGNVLSLQDILSNKQARGAFGEIQLAEIVSKALPPDAFTLQATLSNGKRADCLVHLPFPPGPIAIDAKFPLEAWEALRAAPDARAVEDARRAFRNAVRGHVRAIAERYLIAGETADGALMFLPSEAVYAELHANFGDVVREGFAARVWIVSPTTCMAVLNTVRGVLKDVRMRAQAHAIRRELGLLGKDVERLVERVGNLDRHFAQAQKDVEEIGLSAGKAAGRARRLDSFAFDEPALLPGAEG